MSDHPLFSAISAVHEAALTPDSWPAALDRIRNLVDAQCATLVWVDSSGRTRVSVDVNQHPEAITAMRERYYRPETNPPFRSMLAGPVGAVFPRTALASDDEFRRMDFYHDVFRPQDLWHSIAGCAHRTQTEVMALGMARSGRMGEFTPEETSFVQALLPHIRQTLMVMAKVDALQSKVSDFEAALDHLTFGVILATRNLKVVYANQCVTDMLGPVNGLYLRGDRLHATNPEWASKLNALMARAAGIGRIATGGTMCLPRASELRPLQITIFPLLAAPLWTAVAQADIAVLVTDPERRIVLSQEAIRQLYDLTRREAELACALPGTRDLKEAAARVGMGLNTAKTHLKSIFDKTSACSQADLVRLLLQNSAPWIG